ncbi:hypothetical protein AKN40_1882 [Escherichia coli]|nr:hypothetical protein AKN40_1882 [Escherichia coli]
MFFQNNVQWYFEAFNAGLYKNDLHVYLKNSYQLKYRDSGL